MFDEQNKDEPTPNLNPEPPTEPINTMPTESSKTDSPVGTPDAPMSDVASDELMSAEDKEPTTGEPVETQFPPSLPTENEDTHDAAQIVSSTSDTASSSPVMPMQTSPKKPKKGLLIGIIIAAFLVIVGGGSALAYTLYETPQKVITDAIVGMVTAKTASYNGTVTIDSSGTKAQVELTAKSGAAAGSLTAKITVTIAGKTYTLTGDGVSASNGDLYVKLSNLNDVMSLVKAEVGYTTGGLFDSLQAKIDGTWIKISSSDLSSFNSDASKAQDCYSSALDKYKNDSSATKEITDLYSKYPFITVEKNLGIENGSIGYQLTDDKTAFKSFVDGLSSTSIYKTLHDCDSSFTIDDSTLSSTDSSKGTGTLKVWIGQWSHQLTKVVANSTSDGSTFDATINSTFNQPVTVQTPSNSITLAQLESDISGIFQSVVTK